MKNTLIKTILFGILSFGFSNTHAQQIPTKAQTKSVLITGAKAHLGTGKVIENSLIGFEDGKLTLVADALATKPGKFDIVINANGKHIYPGFIAPNSTLGLIEIDAVKATKDESEIGSLNPHIRSIIAYNPESKLVEVSRPNGVLMAQITPRGGRISGASSIVQLDAWNWEDAILKENDGIHVNWPNTFSYSWKDRTMKPSKNYTKQVTELKTFFKDAKSYIAQNNSKTNLKFESLKGLLNNSQRLFIHTNGEKEIIEAINFAQENKIKNVAIVGGYEAYKVADLLKKHQVAVLLKRVHSLPSNEDEDIKLPFKMAKILSDKGVLVALENTGGMERMQTRNLPFYAGTIVGYGMEYEKALQLITLNTAKILGIDQRCGSLEVGKDATLFISEGDALDMRTNKLTKAFIQGKDISLESYHTKLYHKFKDKYSRK